MTKQEFLISWFRKHPNKKFSNSELEKLLRQDYETEFGGEFRDPLREARKAHENGILQRSPKGPSQAYWYVPSKPPKDMTKHEFLIAWFRKHPNKKFSNSELEKLLRQDYETEFGGDFRDPLREARKAHENGILQRSPKGPSQVYWYDPSKPPRKMLKLRKF